MDWIRRNWPDLLIGIALVAVIAMIVATLLSGGSLASLVRRDNPPELAITDTTGTSAAGTDVAGTNAGTAGTNTAGTNTAGTGTADATDSAGTAGAAAYDVFVPDVPGQPAGAAGGQDTEGGPQAGALPGGTQGGSGVVGSQAAGALPETTATGGYQVAAGATTSRDAAATLAQDYRDEGYEATVEQQGDLYLLWIGPYASDAGAERVAARLRADGLVPDALVYSYDGGGNGGEEDEAAQTTGGAASEGTLAQADAQPNETAGAAGAAQAGSQNAGSGSVAESGVASSVATANVGTGAGDAATAGAGQRYLQVGAFASDESAVPRRAQLENLGLNVSRSEDASGLVRLYVGPFSGAQLAQTQRRLSAAGIVDAFPVSR